MPKSKYHAIAAIDPEDVQQERIEVYHESTTITDGKTGQSIECHYLIFGYRYPAVDNGDGTVTKDKTGRLILTPLRGDETWDSWGLSQYDPNQLKFTLSFNMWDYRNETVGGTEEKKRWFDAYKRVLDMVKEIVIENREAIGEPELEITDLRRKFNGFQKAKDKQTKRVDPTRPEFVRLKVPAFADKETREVKFIPDFYEFGDEEAYPRPDDLLKKAMDIRPTIYIESVFHNAAWTTPQLFLHDAEFGLRQRSSRRMISSSSLNPQVRAADVAASGGGRAVDVSNVSSNAFSALDDDDDDDDDDTVPAAAAVASPIAAVAEEGGGSSSDDQMSGEESEGETKEPPTVVAAAIRRRQPARRRAAE